MIPVSQKQAEAHKEMSSLFQEYGVETEPDTEKGSAFLHGFKVNKTSSVPFTVNIILYFLYNEETYYTQVIHSKKNKNELVSHLRNKNNKTTELSEMLNTSVNVVKKNDKIELTNVNVELEKLNRVGNYWDPPTHAKSEELFNKVYEVSNKEQSIRGKGLIIDYYVQKSDSNIEQKLEIGLTVKLPDNTTEQFICIHDKNTPDKTLTELLSYSEDSKAIAGLKGKKVPVIYDEWTKSWFFHFKKHILDIKYYYERFFGSMGTISFSNRKKPIEQTFNRGV